MKNLRHVVADLTASLIFSFSTGSCSLICVAVRRGVLNLRCCPAGAYLGVATGDAHVVLFEEPKLGFTNSTKSSDSLTLRFRLTRVRR